MNKSLIRKRFEKGLSTYDENAVVQKIMAKNLVELLGAVEFKNILELGCGTGVLTKEVTDNIRFEKSTLDADMKWTANCLNKEEIKI